MFHFSLATASCPIRRYTLAAHASLSISLSLAKDIREPQWLVVVPVVGSGSRVLASDGPSLDVLRYPVSGIVADCGGDGDGRLSGGAANDHLVGGERGVRCGGGDYAGVHEGIDLKSVDRAERDGTRRDACGTPGAAYALRLSNIVGPSGRVRESDADTLLLGLGTVFLLCAFGPRCI